MRPMINAELAPPTVANILYEFVANNEAQKFMRRTLNGAKGESFSLKDERQKTNSHVLFLLTLMQTGMSTEAERTHIVQSEGFMDDYVDDDLKNWDGLVLATLFASDELLKVMLEEIPPEIKRVLVAQMPTALLPRARAHYLT